MFYKETDLKRTDIGEVPRQWEVVTLGDAILEIADGGTPSTKSKEYFNGDVPWVNIEDIQKDISDTRRKLSRLGLEHSSAKIWDKGTIIFSFGASIGKVGIARVPLSTKQGIAGIVPNPAKLFNEFLYYILERNSERVRYISKGMGSTIREVRPPKLRNLIIFPLPTIYEQQKIVEVLSCVDLAIRKTDEIIAKAERLKKGLMQKLLTEGIGNKEFKDTDVGRIPTTWEVKSLQEICLVIIDCPHTTPKLTRKGFLVIKNFNIHNGELLLEPAYYTTEEEWSVRTKRCIPEKGDVLFSREAPIGEACLAPATIKFSLGQRTMLFRPNRILLNPIYLVHAFYSPYVKRRLRILEAGVTAHHVNVADIRRLKIPVPPLKEQEWIASVSYALDEKLNLQRKSKANLERIKQGLMNLLLTGKVRIKVD